MLKRIKKLLEHNALLIAITATIVIAVLSLTSLPKIQLGFKIKSSDKYLHAIAYFVLSSLWYFALQKKLNKSINKFIIIASIILYGIILEALQGGITNYRTADFYDVIANTVGVILASLLFSKLVQWFNAI